MMTRAETKDGRTVKARVVRWEGFGWGVAFEHAGGHDAYPVGSLKAARAEVRRIQLEGRPRSPREVKEFQRIRSIAARV
jgi:hypothetical protein